MDTQLKIDRLQHTIDMLRTLKPDQFYYKSFVNEMHGDCGTICCVGGWYPKWFPDAGLVWVKGSLKNVPTIGVLGRRHIDLNDIIFRLMLWHDITNIECSHLFFGDYSGPDGDVPNLSLSQVIDMWQKFLDNTKSSL